MNRLFFVITGIACGIFGILIIVDPKFHSSKYSYYFDFTETKWVIGGLCFLFAVLALWASLKQGSEKIDTPLICPECEEIYEFDKTKDQKCPKCKIKLEKLRGFYNRLAKLK